MALYQMKKIERRIPCFDVDSINFESCVSSRLCVMLALSVASFLGAYYINCSLGSVILSACLGYILSTDLGGLGSQLLTLCYNRNKVSASRAELRQETSQGKSRSQRSFLWRWGVFEFLYHFVMLAVVGVVSGMAVEKIKGVFELCLEKCVVRVFDKVRHKPYAV